MKDLELNWARNILEVGIGWQIGKERPIYTYMPFTVIFFCSLFRYKYLKDIHHGSSYSLLLHDAIHGWLNAPPDVEGEIRVGIVEDYLGVKTIKDFEQLLDCYKPEDIPTFEEWVNQ